MKVLLYATVKNASGKRLEAMNAQREVTPGHVIQMDDDGFKDF